MLARLSIRMRLTLGFAAALLLILTLAGLFVYQRVSTDLNSVIDDALRARADDLSALVEGSRGRPPSLTGSLPSINTEEGFFQILTPRGEVVSTTLHSKSGAALQGDEVARAARGPTIFHDRVPGIEGQARILGEPAHNAGGQRFVVIAGASTDDRREALAGLTRAFLIWTPLALLVSSALSYVLAGRWVAPLEAGLARERTFVADASHELRTPLAILKAELELADRPERSVAEVRGALRSARTEVDRLAQLAADLLVIARSDRGQLPIARERVELGGLLGRVQERFSRRAEEAGRPIAVEAPPGLAAELDPFRAEQALGNLVENALRHGAGAIALRARRSDGDVVLEVADAGAGFPPGFADKAFERFTRGDAGRSGGGAGLGLAIVNAIAIAHGGAATIAGGPGGVVRLTFPAGAGGRSV
jgi:signal transduction histidine kinase